LNEIHEILIEAAEYASQIPPQKNRGFAKQRILKRYMGIKKQVKASPAASMNKMNKEKENH